MLCMILWHTKLAQELPTAATKVRNSAIIVCPTVLIGGGVHHVDSSHVTSETRHRLKAQDRRYTM